jgi:hypothetical protein
VDQLWTDLITLLKPYVLNLSFISVIITSLASTHASKEWAARYRKYWNADDRRWNNFLVAFLSGALAAVYFYRNDMPFIDLVGFAVVMGGCALAGGWLLNFVTTVLLKQMGLENSDLAKLVKPHRRLTVIKDDAGEVVKIRDEDIDQTIYVKPPTDDGSQ